MSDHLQIKCILKRFCSNFSLIYVTEGGRGRPTHGNLIVAYIPRVGILIRHHAFDLSILYSRREVNYLFMLILTILFYPGVELIFFFKKCQNPHPMPDPPPLGLDTDRCIRVSGFNSVHFTIQSNLSNTDTEGTEQSVRIREVSVLERSRRLRHF